MVVNKWDLALEGGMTVEKWTDYLFKTFGSMRHVPVAFVTAKADVSNPSTTGGAPSSVAYSGRSGSMTEMPTWLMKPMAARSQIAGPIPRATRPTRERADVMDTEGW